MSKINYSVEDLSTMDVVALRKVAKEVGLKNYLKSSKEDLIERISELIELENEDQEQIETQEEELPKDTQEQEEEIQQEEKVAEEKPKKVVKRQEKKKSVEKPKVEEVEKQDSPEEKQSPKTEVPKKQKTRKTVSGKRDVNSKSERVRLIVRSYLESGKAFTSGHVIIKLKEQHNEIIHRSFASALIKKEKIAFEKEQAEK